MIATQLGGPGAVVEEAATPVWFAGFVGGPSAARSARWAVALLGGALAVTGVALAAPHAWYLPVWAVIVAVLPVLTLVDAETRLLPSVIIKPSAALALAVAVTLCTLGVGDWSQLAVALGCATVSFAGYWIVWFTSPAGGFGFGDVRLAGLLGFALGFAGPWATFVGVLNLPLVFGLLLAGLAVARRRGTEDPLSIPFGPSMAAGTFVAMLSPNLFATAILGPLA